MDKIAFNAVYGDYTTDFQFDDRELNYNWCAASHLYIEHLGLRWIEYLQIDNDEPIPHNYRY